MKKSANVGELALKCSYQVALRIAQKKQQYTLGEDFILPSATDMCKTMYGNDIDINKLKTVPLSDKTIARPIDEMASDGFLFCKRLPEGTTSTEIDAFFKENEISWDSRGDLDALHVSQRVTCCQGHER